MEQYCYPATFFSIFVLGIFYSAMVLLHHTVKQKRIKPVWDQIRPSKISQIHIRVSQPSEFSKKNKGKSKMISKVDDFLTT